MIDVMNPTVMLNERVQEFLSQLENITGDAVMASQGLLPEVVDLFGMAPD